MHAGTLGLKVRCHAHWRRRYRRVKGGVRCGVVMMVYSWLCFGLRWQSIFTDHSLFGFSDPSAIHMNKVRAALSL
eukprot:1134534-Rhodomonas_salina.6